MNKLKIVLISDTHNMHGMLVGKYALPKADVLIHAGDITMAGDLDPILNFNEWIGTLPYKHKIVIAGNHDRLGVDSTGNPGCPVNSTPMASISRARLVRAGRTASILSWSRSAATPG